MPLLRRFTLWTLIVSNVGNYPFIRLLTVLGEMAVEAFTCMLVFKNMFSFVLTFYAYNWFAHGGIKHTMVVIGSIQVGICLLSIPMCKRILSSLPALDRDPPN